MVPLRPELEFRKGFLACLVVQEQAKVYLKKTGPPALCVYVCVCAIPSKDNLSVTGLSSKGHSTTINQTDLVSVNCLAVSVKSQSRFPFRCSSIKDPGQSMPLAHRLRGQNSRQHTNTQVHGTNKRKDTQSTTERIFALLQVTTEKVPSFEHQSTMHMFVPKFTGRSFLEGNVGIFIVNLREILSGLNSNEQYQCV